MNLDHYHYARGYIEDAHNTQGQVEQQTALAYAQAHATIAVADRLDKVLALFAAVRAEVGSVPVPNVVDPATATEIVRQGMTAKGATS